MHASRHPLPSDKSFRRNNRRDKRLPLINRLLPGDDRRACGYLHEVLTPLPPNNMAIALCQFFDIKTQKFDLIKLLIFCSNPCRSKSQNTQMVNAHLQDGTALAIYFAGIGAKIFQYQRSLYIKPFLEVSNERRQNKKRYQKE
jgi:hypothetical protein